MIKVRNCINDLSDKIRQKDEYSIIFQYHALDKILSVS